LFPGCFHCVWLFTDMHISLAPPPFNHLILTPRPHCSQPCAALTNQSTLIVAALLVPAGVATTHPPSSAPTDSPSSAPTMLPSSAHPTHDPTHSPTHDPTTWEPTLNPTTSPPTHPPTEKPTHAPTQDPTAEPTITYRPTFKPTIFTGPEGAGWGMGCSYLCDDNLEGVKELFDDFSTFTYSTLNSSFTTTRSDLKDIIDDASTMLVAKVAAKAAALSHQHARLEATHRVLVDLLGDADAHAAANDAAERVAEEALVTITSEKEVHSKPGVLWTTFGLQIGLAVVAGIFVESSRIRSAAAARRKTIDGR